jgi:hypothetical protein
MSDSRPSKRKVERSQIRQQALLDDIGLPQEVTA